MRRFGSGIAIAAAIAAMLVPAAQARPVSSGSSFNQFDPWMQNLIVRQSEARASSSKLQARVLTPTEVKYYQAENAFYKTHYPGIGSTPAATASDGTDWAKVGGGIGGGVLALLLAAGVVVTMRRSRRPVHA
jgi:hypothetical protein